MIENIHNVHVALEVTDIFNLMGECFAGKGLGGRVRGLKRV